MVLDNYRDGASRHLTGVFPVDEDSRRLTFILCLPLVDGVFATLLVSGALETFSSILSVALTVFTGAGALAVLYSSNDSRSEARKMVSRAAPVLVLGALAVSMIAPVFESMIYVERMSLAVGLALLVLALDMLDVEIAENLSIPAIVITGLLLSVKNLSSLAFSTEYLMPTLATSMAAVTGLYLASLINPERLDLGIIRNGGALVLASIALSMLGFPVPDGFPLTILGISLVASIRSE